MDPEMSHNLRAPQQSDALGKAGSKMHAIALRFDAIRKYKPLIQPKCWPCMFFFTCISALFALSGAIYISDAIKIIGVGLFLDAVRWGLHRHRFTQAFWLANVDRTQSDQKYFRAIKNTNRYWILLVVMVFVINGSIWAIFCPPESVAINSILVHAYPEPRAILRVSHVARSFFVKLGDQGYTGRARLWEFFVFDVFSLYIVSILAGVFWWSKSMIIMNTIVILKYFSNNNQKPNPFYKMVTFSFVAIIIGFLVINNFITLRHADLDAEALATSNTFFMTYSIQMLFTCIFVIYSFQFVSMHCLGFSADLKHQREGNSDE